MCPPCTGFGPPRPRRRRNRTGGNTSSSFSGYRLGRRLPDPLSKAKSVPMTVVVLIACNLLLAGLFSLVAVVLD
ncbi:hypothetical protein ASG52_23760 [Methylobacterium sp. Leaf456]|nr:hypothetical protein ASG52_23760 [Methylobacterium sp. Leaf456]